MRFQRIHAFSRSIGNTDAHLGNYGLVFDDSGRATLAPAYDVLPMALAPRHDELPDPFVTRAAPPVDAATRKLVENLREAVSGDSGISAPFRERWCGLLALE